MRLLSWEDIKRICSKHPFGATLASFAVMIMLMLIIKFVMDLGFGMWKQSAEQELAQQMTPYYTTPAELFDFYSLRPETTAVLSDLTWHEDKKHRETLRFFTYVEGCLLIYEAGEFEQHQDVSPIGEDGVCTLDVYTGSFHLFIRCHGEECNSLRERFAISAEHLGQGE